MSFIRPEDRNTRLRRTGETGTSGASLTESEIAQIGAINNTSSYCRTLFFSYLALGTTLFILVSGTTHEDLLRETPVKMPLFDIGVPLLTFYVVAPLLFVLFHVNLLNKLSQLRKQIEKLDGAEKESIRGRLFPFDYALLFGGFEQDWKERVVLWTIVGSTLFVMPALLLLYTQYQFLAYHSGSITAWHSVIVTFDLGALVFFHHVRDEFPNFRFIASTFIIMVSWLVLVTPDSRLDRYGTKNFWDNEAEAMGLFRNLQLSGRTFWESDPPPENVAAYEAAHGFSDETQMQARLRYGRPMDLRGRDIRYANLAGAKLIDARLERIQLQRANLSTAELQGATLWSANLQGTNLAGAELRGASLWSANLRNANLRDAGLQGANMGDAIVANDTQTFRTIFGEKQASRAALLQGANLSRAQAQGANFVGVMLQEATLDGAHLQGANLHSANLQGSDLSNAHLQGANLVGASLQGSDLSDAHLQGVELRGAALQGADLSDAQLQGADLRGAALQGAKIWDSQLQGADLSGTHLQGTYFFGAAIQGANFSKAELQLADFFASNDREPPVQKRARFWAGIFETTEGVPEGTQRDKLLIRLRTAAQRPIEPDFGAREDFVRRVSGSLPGSGQVFEGWPETDPETYNERLTEFLANLACFESNFANGVALHRIRISQVGAELAGKLVRQECVGKRELIDTMSPEAIGHIQTVINIYDQRTSPLQ